MDALKDTEFLKLLDENRSKTIYAKIISLTMEEFPQEEITGKVISGSINVDGKSALRRTCSLSLIANKVNLNSFYWGLYSKFKLFIGVKNEINNDYPGIIWFPQGIFIITNFSSSQSVNSYTISITGKDKMCLLNGDLGGTLTAISTRFDLKEDGLKDKSIIREKSTIKEIIYKLVNELGGESIPNIVINNLEDYGLELLDYNGDVPLYLLFNANNELYQIYISQKVKVFYKKGNDWKQTTINKLPEDFEYNDLNIISGKAPSTIKLSKDGKTEYTVMKRLKGEAVGYRLTDITYAGELIASAGDSLTSVLDKIVSQLGDFEYFYDVNGRFIFQRKKTYLNINWNPIENSKDAKPNSLTTIDSYVQAAIYASPLSYNFEGNKLLTSMSNQPNLLNLRNDYSIWGKKKTLSGLELDIHFRFAIDKKPTRYKTYFQEEYTSNEYDWRELIYQMAKDYYSNKKKDDFIPTLIKNNPEFYLGKTGYEAYYQDMQAFWRDIYDPNPDASNKNNFYSSKDPDDKKFWNKEIYKDPSRLKFWIDFLDTDGELGKYSVQSIGRRPTVIKDDKVKTLFHKFTPSAIFYTDSKELNKKSGYQYFSLGQNAERFFDISNQGKSSQEVLNQLLYQHTCAQETVSISSIPIYYLEPNTLIYLKDDQNLDINGKYTITNFSIQLAHSGLMNITASKKVDKLL